MQTQSIYDKSLPPSEKDRPCPQGHQVTQSPTALQWRIAPALIHFCGHCLHTAWSRNHDIPFINQLVLTTNKWLGTVCFKIWKLASWFCYYWTNEVISQKPLLRRKMSGGLSSWYLFLEEEYFLHRNIW